MGAIASGGARVLNDASLHVERKDIDAAVAREQRELERRELLYRDGCPTPRLAGRTVLLVDDGLATGASMRAAVGGEATVARPRRRRRSRRSARYLRRAAGRGGRGRLRAHTGAIPGRRPVDATHFRQTSDEEVRELLESRAGPPTPASTDEALSTTVFIR